MIKSKNLAKKHGHTIGNMLKTIVFIGDYECL
jgi:hypothetical protein